MERLETLFAPALEARKQAYAPYSDFAVGAAILGQDGKIYTGCNVENISYPCGTCAEQAAIAKMVSSGCHKISAILVIADTKNPITPCGACLQRIKEFSDDNTMIGLANLQGICGSFSLNRMLPLAFNNQELKK